MKNNYLFKVIRNNEEELARFIEIEAEDIKTAVQKLNNSFRAENVIINERRFYNPTKIFRTLCNNGAEEVQEIGFQVMTNEGVKMDIYTFSNEAINYDTLFPNHGLIEVQNVQNGRQKYFDNVENLKEFLEENKQWEINGAENFYGLDFFNCGYDDNNEFLKDLEIFASSDSQDREMLKALWEFADHTITLYEVWENYDDGDYIVFRSMDEYKNYLQGWVKKFFGDNDLIMFFDWDKYYTENCSEEAIYTAANGYIIIR